MGAKTLATYHPSAVLRAQDGAEQVFEALCADLVSAARNGRRTAAYRC